MKKLFTIITFFIISISSYPQEIIETSARIYDISTQKWYPMGFDFSVKGYHTHFSTVDTNYISLIQGGDTIKTVSGFHYLYQNNFLNLGILPKVTKPGIWDLTITNDSDGVINYPHAFYADSFALVGWVDMAESNYNLKPDSNVNVKVWNSYNYPMIPRKGYFVNHTFNDTIYVDSILVTNNFTLNLYTHIPAQAVGYYDIYVSNGDDSLLMAFDKVFVHNPNRVQIDSLSPDEVYGVPGPVPITVYGNNTHFTDTDNFVFLMPYSNWFSNVQIINDTLITFDFYPISNVKQAQYPTCWLMVYNPVDGLLKYPFATNLTGGIEQQPISFKKVQLFPNPGKNIIHIQSEEFMESPVVITLYSLDMKAVKRFKVRGQSHINLQISDIPLGLYLLYIQSDKKSDVLKFVKE